MFSPRLPVFRVIVLTQMTEIAKFILAFRPALLNRRDHFGRLDQMADKDLPKHWAGDPTDGLVNHGLVSSIDIQKRTSWLLSDVRRELDHHGVVQLSSLTPPIPSKANFDKCVAIGRAFCKGLRSIVRLPASGLAFRAWFVESLIRAIRVQPDSKPTVSCFPGGGGFLSPTNSIHVRHLG